MRHEFNARTGDTAIYDISYRMGHNNAARGQIRGNGAILAAILRHRTKWDTQAI
jgi:hypothetical protein